MSKPEAVTGVRPLTSVLKALAVLDALGRSSRPMKLAEVAAAVSGSRATTYQKLVTLIAGGWVEQADTAYRVSLHSAHVAAAALEQADLGERAASILRSLVDEVHETASVAVLSGTHARLVKRVEAEVVVRAQVRIGTLLSLDNSSSGRILTAFASEAQRRDLERAGAVMASSTILNAVRRNSHAVSTGRDVPGVQSVAVPLFNAQRQCVAALSIVAPVNRFDVSRYLEPLARAAERIGRLTSLPLGSEATSAALG